MLDGVSTPLDLARQLDDTLAAFTTSDSLPLGSPNPDEVAEIFEAPLGHFLKREGHTTAKPKRGKLTQTIHFMPYENKLIWGATAAILDKLAAHFE